MRRTAHVHRTVLATAIELCLSEYETLMGNNQLREAWKLKHPGASERTLQKAWVARYARSFIGPARTMLTLILTSGADDGMKSAVHSALVADNMLTRGRNPAV